MKRSGTRNFDNHKLFLNFLTPIAKPSWMYSEKQTQSGIDCDKVAINSEFIWCLRLFKKVYKKML